MHSLEGKSGTKKLAVLITFTETIVNMSAFSSCGRTATSLVCFTHRLGTYAPTDVFESVFSVLFVVSKCVVRRCKTPGASSCRCKHRESGIGLCLKCAGYRDKSGSPSNTSLHLWKTGGLDLCSGGYRGRNTIGAQTHGGNGEGGTSPSPCLPKWSSESAIDLMFSSHDWSS